MPAVVTNTLATGAPAAVGLPRRTSVRGCIYAASYRTLRPPAATSRTTVPFPRSAFQRSSSVPDTVRWRGGFRSEDAFRRCLWNPAPGAQRTTHTSALSKGTGAVQASETSNTSKTVSVVIPLLNEVGSIALLVKRVITVMNKMKVNYEVICVDDGSTDGSTQAVIKLAKGNPNVRGVILRRNFGQTAALKAGFDTSKGDVVVTMDGDLQNDPSDIPRLVKVLLEGEDADGMAIQSRLTGRRGYDLVCGWRQDRKDDNFTRRLPSFLANLLISKMTGVKLKDYGCSLKAFQRDLVDQLRPYGEMHRFLPMLAVLEGATLTEMPVKHHARSAGESKYSALGRTPRVLADLATILFMQKFMTKPMHFMGVVGGLLMLAGVLVMIASIAVHIPTLCYMSIGEVFSLVCGFLVLGLELFISGIQVLVLGFIAEVLVRTYFESQGRPIYTVRTILGEGL